MPTVRRYREGAHDTAIERVTRAMRLSPIDSYMYMMQAVMASARFVAGRYDETIRWADRALAARPVGGTMRIAAASDALAGRMKQAQSMIARVLEFDPWRARVEH